MKKENDIVIEIKHVTKEYKISHCFSLKTTAKLLKKREIWYNNTEYFQKWYNLERKLRFYFAIC